MESEGSALEGHDYGRVWVGVLLEVIYKTISGIVPSAEAMGIIGALVLLGNGICFLCFFATDPMTSTCAPHGCARATTSSLICRFW